MNTIPAFIAALAAMPVAVDATNMYAGKSTAAAIKRENLRLYLEELLRRKTTLALIGEAPGYQGARGTGISFTSEYQLTVGIPALGMFLPGSGYRVAQEHGRLWKEPSATIVWRTLSELQCVPLLWPAYPFHPHHPGKPLSNRPPRREEIHEGAPFLTALIALLGINQVVAVGNVADGTLTTLGIPHAKIRHPSHGGAGAFAAGLRAVLAS